MMRNYVIDLDTAKELKEIGIEQDSVWYWYETKSIIGITTKKEKDNDLCKFYSAFTGDELIKKLPSFIYRQNDSSDLYFLMVDTLINEKTELYRVSYRQGEQKVLIEFTRERLSVACAEMMKWIIKEGRRIYEG